ncbi:MAG: competence/damage-inducible protein A [Deltaproteobacteria bacterium]|nr:competence/damage-inducible protein A [Deltaproteobacteria bacterium]
MPRPAPAPTAAIIVIGDEVLSGKVEEQNARFLVRELRALGVAVRRIEVVPDVEDEIASVVRAAAAAHDHVFTSGGVGPTHDDVTVAGIAAAFGVPVVRDRYLADLIREVGGDRFFERDLRGADVPEGAVLLRGDGSPQARWPVVAMRNVYVLPGVPSILQRKFATIRERFRAAPFVSRQLYSRECEGAIADALDKAAADFPGVAIGSYPHLDAPDHRVLVTLDGRDRAAVEGACAQLLAALGPAIVRVE